MRLLTEEELDGMVDNSNELKEYFRIISVIGSGLFASVVLCGRGTDLFTLCDSGIQGKYYHYDQWWKAEWKYEAMMALTDIGYSVFTKNIGSEMELFNSRTIVESRW